MGLMKSEDGLDMMLDCDCGCLEGIRLSVKEFSDDSFVILSYTNGSFYRGQNESFFSVFKKKMKKIWAIIRNKDYVYSEIVINKTDYSAFCEYLNGVKEMAEKN